MIQITTNFSSGTRNVIKNIASEVVRECAKQGVTATPEVASLAVVLLALDPDHGLSLSSPSDDRLTLENFVKNCVAKFSDHLSTSIRTLEIQEFFIRSSIDSEEILKKYHGEIELKTTPIMKEIIEADHPNREEQEKLLKKIMIYINMSYLLGSASSAQVLTETSNALKSVLSRSDLANFFVLKKKAKIQQLLEIQAVVCGIRVFNKDAGHCGEGIRDIQSDIAYAFKNTKNNLIEILDSVTAKTKKITDALNTLYTVDLETQKLTFNLPDGITKGDFNHLKGILTMNLQHKIYINSILKSVNQLKLEIDRKLEEFRKILDVLHDIVQYRTAVPTEKVFPHFTKVSIVWRSLLDCIYLLIEFNKTNERMSKMSSSIHSYENILQKIESVHNVEDYAFHSEPTFTVHALSQEVNKLNYDYIGPHNQMTVNASPISKFCPYIFTAGDGLLIPSKTNAGYLKYNGILLSFSTIEYASIFLSNVEYYFTAFMNTIRKHPEVVVFFDIYDILNSYRGTEIKTSETTEQLARNDSQMQTELHPIPFFKDPLYTWNIWDLRRKSIQLANLKNKRTHSTQTDHSYYRLNANLQTADPKTSSCQTRCDASTNITKKDATTDCVDDDKLIGIHATATCSAKCTAPLKSFYTVPYRLNKK